MYFKKPPPIFAPQMSVKCNLKRKKQELFAPKIYYKDDMGLNTFTFSSAPLWLLHQFQSLWECYLLCHGAPCTSLALLPFWGTFCPFLRMFTLMYACLTVGLSFSWTHLDLAGCDTGQPWTLPEEDVLAGPYTPKNFPAVSQIRSQNHAPQY